MQIDPLPLGEIVGRLEKLYGTRIDVDWEGIEAAGLPLRPESNVLVELRLRQVTLRQGLAKVLESLPDGDTLVVEAANGSVRIRTLPVGGPGAAPSPGPAPIARLYDVSELVAMMEFERKMGVNFEGIVFDGPPPSAKSVQQELQSLVMDSVWPETWIGNGGSFGAVHVAGGRMVVVETPEVQAEVVKVLDDLREFLRAPYQKGGAVAGPQP